MLRRQVGARPRRRNPQASICGGCDPRNARHPRHRRGRLHRLSCDAAAAVATAEVSSASTTSTTYYDPTLKEARLARARQIYRISLSSSSISPTARRWRRSSREHKFPHVVHLAAQAGVRYSLINPHAYVDANLQGFLNVLEGCRHNGCRASAVSPRRRRSTAPIPSCRSRCMTMSTIRSASMPRARRPTN